LKGQDESVPPTPDAKQLRSFGLIVGGVFGLIGLWPVVWHGMALRRWSIIIASLLIGPALVWPHSLTHVYRLWMLAGLILSWINTRIMLGLVFYSLFTPVGVVRRLLGKDTMRLQVQPEADTYRIVRQPRARSHMTRQF
jgi:hypothetical protein